MQLGNLRRVRPRAGRDRAGRAHPQLGARAVAPPPLVGDAVGAARRVRRRPRDPTTRRSTLAAARRRRVPARYDVTRSAPSFAILRGDVGENPPGWEAALRAVPADARSSASRSRPSSRWPAASTRHASRSRSSATCPQRFPVGVRWAATVAQIGRCAVLLGDAEVADVVHGLLLDTATYYSGDGSGGIFSHGSNAGLLGELALDLRRRRHWRSSTSEPPMAMNVRVGARPFVALARLGRGAGAGRAGRAPDRGRRGCATALPRSSRGWTCPGPLRAAERLATASRTRPFRRSRRARPRSPPSWRKPCRTRRSRHGWCCPSARSSRTSAAS